MRLIAIGGAASLAAAATLSLLCAAAFVFVMDRYNILYACLTVAGIWLILTLTLLDLLRKTSHGGLDGPHFLVESRVCFIVYMRRVARRIGRHCGLQKAL